ncbi:hypothetical protein K7G98_31445, partial [Saccharothrix sp. MB29]|nr:hypothetical protein [Saccharothrix sp. MB29]
MGGVTCPECSAPVSPKDRFCEACGRNLRVRRTPVGGPGSQWPPLCACGGAEFDEDGSCEACGRERPSARDRVEFALPGVAGISDRGRRRRRAPAGGRGAAGRRAAAAPPPPPPPPPPRP